MFEQLVRVANQTVSSGYIVALALVCLLQYAYQLYQRRHWRKENRNTRRELASVQGQLKQAHREKTLSDLENTILREFVAHTDIHQALATLLPYFTAKDNGFAAILMCEEGTDALKASHGLSEESRLHLQIDPALREELMRQQAVVLEERRLTNSDLWASLAPEDRHGISSLYLIAITEADEFVGTFVCTALYPAGATQNQQIELAERLMLSVAGDLKDTQTLARQEDQLWTTREMLDLRSVVDEQFDSPLALVNEFLDRLIDKVEADRGVLYLSSGQTEFCGRPVARGGIPLQPEVRREWLDGEQRLAEAASGEKTIQIWDKRSLAFLGIQYPIRRAVVLPIAYRGTPLGTVCLTNSPTDELAESHLRLLTWAGEFLGEMIPRAWQQATIKWEAQVDGLTGLANRRSFEQYFQQELAFARQTGDECSLLLLDLDHFKQINDNFGHQAGDELLRIVGGKLQEAVDEIRSGDRAFVARYGGEELAVVLSGVGSAGAARIAEAIRAAVETSSTCFQGQSLQVTASVGFATFPTQADDADALIAATDRALYHAKQSGRNRVSSAVEVPV